MYPSSQAPPPGGGSTAASAPRRRKKQRGHAHGVKTVDVARGRNGYGFTISGQHPCILSCIVSGSPADRAGLKTGDFLLAVNTRDVSQASHDDVVRMIGSSRGVLALQITENVNSEGSSSEDEDMMIARPKSKYPNNRMRKQHPAVTREPDIRPRGRREEKQLRALSPLGRESSSHRSDKYHGMDMRSMGVENIDPSGPGAMGPPLAPPPHHHGHHSKRHKQMSSNEGGVIRYRSPNTKHTIITREARMGSKNLETRGAPIGAEPSGNRRSRSSYDHLPPTYDELENENMMLDYLRVVVGYVGTIGMARNSVNDAARAQSIRSAVNRLKVERKLTTMVLMELAVSGVRLVNNSGTTVAVYAAEHIAFSGVHSEDKRFFGIVTFHVETSREEESEISVSDSSCHVFKVNPELCAHSQHAHKARSFGIQRCTLHQDTQQCLEFPRSAVPLVRCMSHLYRERRSSRLYDSEMAHMGGFAQPAPNNFPAQQRQRRDSNSSDSGVGTRPSAKPANRVCVVDMNSDVSYRDPRSSSSYKFGDPNISVIFPEEPRVLGSGTSDFSLPPNPANTSESSQDTTLNTMERLNVRAMPDPHKPIPRHQQQLLEDDYDDDADTESVALATPSSTIITGSGALSSTRNESTLYPDYIAGVGRSIMTGPNVSAISSASSSESSSCSSGHSFDSASAVTPLYTRSLPRPPNYPSRPVPPAPGNNLPSAKRPPVPDRKPIIPRKNPKTPLKPPPGKKHSRPKSTPPFKRNKYVPEPPVAEQDGYDSDPGSVSVMDTVAMDTADTVTEEDWSREVASSEQKQGAGVGGKDPAKDPRRFSEGYVLGRQKERQKKAELEGSKKTGSFRQNTNRPFRRSNLSNSHESLVVTDPSAQTPAPHQTHRLTGAASVTAITKQGAVVTQQPSGLVETVGRASSWAVSFDKLLHDELGLQIFTEFLKKEYSEENIVFWKKCETFRKLTTADQRHKHASDIYSAHMAASASDPVNVDSSAKATVEAALTDAGQGTFDVAQGQIFRLMKQDSYSRFLRSDGYKSCVVAEMEGKPLPITATAATDEANNNVKAPPTPVDRWKKTLKKSRSSSSAEEPGGGEEKRRRSLLPWNKKDKDRKISKMSTDTDLSRGAPLASAESLTSDPSRPSDPPRPSTDLADLGTLSKQANGNVEEIEASSVTPRDSHRYLRVVLPDSSTTVIPAGNGGPGNTTLRQAVSSLCSRRHISLATVAVTVDRRPADLCADLHTLGSRTVALEKRVVVRADLPRGRVVCVQARPAVTISVVFTPVLARYGLSASTDKLVMHVAGTGVILKDDQIVDTLDQKHVLVQSLDDFKEWGSYGSHRSSKPPVIPRDNPRGYPQSGKPLDDVINHMFKDVLGDSLPEVVFDDIGVWEANKPRPEEPRSSGILGFIRRNSIGDKETSGKLKTKTTSKVSGSTTTKVFSAASSKQSGSRLPPPPPQPIGAQPPVAAPRPPRGKRYDADDEQLFKLLNRAQSRQLDDQRGLSAGALDLPDFLRPNEVAAMATHGNKNVVSMATLRGNNIATLASAASIRNSDIVTTATNGYHSSSSDLVSMAGNSHMATRTREAADGAQSFDVVPTPRAKSAECLLDSTSNHQRQMSAGLMTPRTAKLAGGGENSFDDDGIMPTPTRAMNYFTDDIPRPLSPDFENSQLMERSLRDLGMSSDLQNTHQGRSFNAFMSNGAVHSANEQPRPRVPRRQNPPGKPEPQSTSHMPEPERLRGGHPAVPASSDEDLDITLIPPSDSEAEDMLGRTSPNIQEYLSYAPIPSRRPNHFSTNHRAAPDGGVHTGPASNCSGSTTPSPTTHDLVLDSGTETESVQSREAPEPAPRITPTRQANSSQDNGSSGGSRAKKSLAFDRHQVRTDIQVSFV